MLYAVISPVGALILTLITRVCVRVPAVIRGNLVSVCFQPRTAGYTYLLLVSLSVSPDFLAVRHVPVVCSLSRLLAVGGGISQRARTQFLSMCYSVFMVVVGPIHAY
jgi:hypothetical protein